MIRLFALLFALAASGSLGIAFAAPADVDARLEQARQALQRGDADLALRLAEEAAKDHPQAAQCFLRLGMIRDARREFAEAVDAYRRAIELAPAEVGAYEHRGEDYFRLGEFEKSVADFDRVIALEPDRAPYHWQRGLSLYYAGDFAAGAKQFELHRTVNPEDVENAAWHFLCVARASGLDEARKTLIPINADARPPMMEIFAMFAGRSTPDDVLAAARDKELSGARGKEAMFYARLYIALYERALGHAEADRENMLKAAELAPNDYMGDLARVDAKRIKEQDKAK